MGSPHRTRSTTSSAIICLKICAGVCGALFGAAAAAAAAAAAFFFFFAFFDDDGDAAAGPSPSLPPVSYTHLTLPTKA